MSNFNPGSLVFIDPPAGEHVQIMFIDDGNEVGRSEYIGYKKIVYFIDYFLGSKDLCKIIIDGKLAWCQVRFLRSEDGL